MIIKELQIENFRGIKNLSIPLNKSGAVFYGVNGVGKSTVLKAINILFSYILDRVSQGRFKNAISMNEDDVRYGNSVAKIKAFVSIESEDFEVFRGYDKKKRSYIIDLSKSVIHLSNFIKMNLEESEFWELPVVAFYGVNRSVVDIPLRIRDKHSFDRIAAYEKSSAGSDFRMFFEWYRNQEDYENQVLRSERSSNYEDKQLRAVREAIYKFMPGFSNLMVDRKPRLRMVISKGNTKLAIDQLSDGEKCYIAMIGDLARRMAVANPTMENPLKCSGIVLIDEIELHLHPEWQREIVPALRRTFPNIQFIITTHSPQVLGEITDMDVFKLLKEDNIVSVKRILSAFGRDSAFILEQLMDTPEKNVMVSDKISRMYEYIALKQFCEASAIVEELSNEVGNDDADVAKARILIARGKAKSEADQKKTGAT